MEIQQAVEEILAIETEYHGVHVQPSHDRSKEVITSHINYQSKPKANFKEIKMENLNEVLEEYRSQCLGTDILKLQIDREKLWRNTLTFYKKCMNDPRQLFKCLEDQFSYTT